MMLCFAPFGDPTSPPPPPTSSLPFNSIVSKIMSLLSSVPAACVAQSDDEDTDYEMNDSD